MSISDKSQADENGSYVLEGKKRVADLLVEPRAVQKIVISSSFARDEANLSLIGRINETGILLETIKDREFQKQSSVRTPQGILAVLEKKYTDWQSFVASRPERVIALDTIQDPGNLGTIFRTALCSGFKHIITGDGCADPYSEKTLSAFTGNIADLELLDSVDLETVLNDLKKSGFKIIATGQRQGESCFDYAYPEKFVLVFGAEGSGISPAVFKTADSVITIPMSGKMDSLNVGVASGIIMFDYLRRYPVQCSKRAFSSPGNHGGEPRHLRPQDEC